MDKKKLYLLLGVDQFDNPIVAKVLGYDEISEDDAVLKAAGGPGSVDEYKQAVKPKLVVVELP